MNCTYLNIAHLVTEVANDHNCFRTLTLFWLPTRMLYFNVGSFAFATQNREKVVVDFGIAKIRRSQVTCAGSTVRSC